MHDHSTAPAAPALPAAPADNARPADVPDKFWDAEKGALRADSLMQSYRELERKLGTMVPLPAEGGAPEDTQRLHRALGVPDAPDGYAIETGSGVFESDPEINARLHQAGFSQQQAQLVYSLAEEVVLPLIAEAAADFEGERQTDALRRHFGEERWPEVSRQVSAWGEAHLPPDVFTALSTTREGVVVMHQMMTKGEPALLGAGGGAAAGPDESGLNEMMKDPRYWRDRDPALVERVRAGFRALYPGQA